MEHIERIEINTDGVPSSAAVIRGLTEVHNAIVGMNHIPSGDTLAQLFDALDPSRIMTFNGEVVTFNGEVVRSDI